MPEHLFLCGLSEEQRSAYSIGTSLSLDKENGNLYLNLDQIRTRLVGNEPQRLTDFLEIASYVFAADRTTSRGPLTDPGIGRAWRRVFHIVVAVREVTFWQQQSVKEALSDALGFLSEDTWRFDFVPNEQPIPFPDYFNLKPQDAETSGGTSIILFSGGLDSLGGAVHELQFTIRHVVLVSHRNVPGLGRRQQILAKQLADANPRRVTHVSIDNQLTGRLIDRERTQRTRSFFFAAMACVAAHIENADRIQFFENGIMSVNLPIATQVVGARASRSTHPHSLQLLNRVVKMLALHPMSISNPFLWKTKAEVVQELARSPQAALIATSVSCSRAWTANQKYQPHCGRCIQCLQRRMATLAGGASTYDEAEGYEADFLTAPRQDGLDRAMALGAINLALDCATISDADFLGRFAGPVSWVMQAFEPSERDDFARKLLDLFRRHGQAVRKVLIEAAKPHVPEVVDRRLPPESLLALVLASRLSEQSTVPADAPVAPTERLPEPELEHATATGTASDEIIIALDKGRQRILIRDWPALSGPMIFPVFQFLIDASLADRAKPGLPSQYRSFRGREIADRVGAPDEVAVRQAVRRVRKTLREAADALGIPFDENALIERTRKGYRLNRRVIVVTPAEFIAAKPRVT